MSRSPGRRKSTFKIISGYKESSGPLLKFKWSVSAAHLAVLEDNERIILPAISTDRSRRKNLNTTSCSSTDQSSVSHSSISTHKYSSRSNATKQNKSPTSTASEKRSGRSNPLSLTYAQLHQPSSSSPINRRKQPRFSIFPEPNEKRDSPSVVNRKLSVMSRQSIASVTTISLLSTKTEKSDSRLPNDNLIRLNSSQLRRLNVSEKYFHEAKKLYFNAECKIFTPRIPITQVF